MELAVDGRGQRQNAYFLRRRRWFLLRLRREAGQGTLYWRHDMKAHVWGSTLVADGKVYVGDEDGDFVVLAATKEKRVLSKTVRDGREEDGPNLGAPIYSTPIVANGVLYFNSHTHLFAMYAPAKAKERLA